MTHSEIEKRINDKAKTNFDGYDVVVKIHTAKIGDQTAKLEEVKSGQIKINGSEQFSSYAEMIECMIDGTTITTEIV